ETLERFAATRLVEKGWRQAGEHAVFGHLDALCAQLRLEPDLADDLLNHAQREIGAAYRSAKTELAQFDFSDLLQCLYAALKAEDGRFASAIRAQYPVALVDEFQDTDPWQYGALSRIYVESPSADTGLIMIGDPKQAIYSFRGADLQTYLGARAQVQAIHTLSGNYRSTSELVAAVNHVFTQAEKPFGEVPFEPVLACNDLVVPLRRGEQQLPAMTVWHQVHDKAPTKPQFLRTMAEIFATRMVALLNEGWAEPGSMAVLVRSGTEARVIRNELSRRGVRSVYLSERDSVFETTEASDLWRILRAVASPRNTQWMRAALSTRLWGLPWSELETLLQDEDAWDAQVDQFHAWQKIWQRQGFLPMLQQLLHAASIAQRMLDQGADESHDGERRLTNVLHLGDLLQAASARLQGEGALVRFLEEQLRNPKASGDAAQLRLESDANLVQVVTVHKAKGLQYPLVFLPFVSNFMAEKKDSGRDDGARLAEDIRLLYVALTRAEQGLWLGVAQVKGDVDGDKPQAMSALSAVLQRKTEQDLATRLQVWAECADILVASAPAADVMRYAPATPLREWKAALTPERVLASRWWTASFSAISRDLGHGAPTPLTSARDERMGDDQIDSSAVAASDAAMALAGSDDSRLSYNGFPAGASYGTLLHDLLEWQTNRGWPAMQASSGAANDLDWQALLERKAQRLKLDDVQRDLVDLWIRAIVQTPLPMGNEGAALLLGALDAQTAWAEMGFTLPVHRLGTAELDQLICYAVLPGQPRAALQPRQLEGMLTGFMDMVLEHEGRYYVLDYKSNWLASYGRDSLRDAILAHRYDVQYTLYLLALHRLLKSRLKDYDYDRHVGGVLYLFLRGIAQPGAGLFVDRPPKALIESLDAAFSEKLNPAKAQA
ncbi:MAG: 3'-5' exonuclease, partial [Betaproteobacteria bacterium]